MCSSIQIHANLYSKTICCSIFYKKQVNNWYIQQILPENENKQGVSGKTHVEQHKMDCDVQILYHR